MVLFECRRFWLPKDVGFAHEYEDASAVDDRRGVVAIADGVASAMFSRQWAELLTRAVVEDTPEAVDGFLPREWLAVVRKAWRESIEVDRLNFFQRQKLQQVGGGYCTLLWVVLEPAAAEDVGDSSPEVVASWRGYALGDCCLFHVRGTDLLASFPILNSAEFDLDPLSVPSLDRGHDHLLRLGQAVGECQAGDLLVLATDAVAKSLLQQMEGGAAIDWNEFWTFSSESFNEYISNLRANQAIRFDDSTLVVLRICERIQLEERPDEEPERELADDEFPIPEDDGEPLQAIADWFEAEADQTPAVFNADATDASLEQAAVADNRDSATTVTVDAAAEDMAPLSAPDEADPASPDDCAAETAEVEPAEKCDALPSGSRDDDTPSRESVDFPNRDE